MDAMLQKVVRNLLQAGQHRLAKSVFLFSLAAIMVLALLPQASDSLASQHDKLAHCALFFVLGLAGAAIYAPYAAGQETVRLMIALLAYGAAMEILQGATAYRTASAADWVADLIGIFAGTVVFYLLLRALRISL